MKKLFHILIFAFAFLVIWNTDIVNRTEAEDAFSYAYQVENNGVEWLYHPHHLLYGAVSKDLYNGARLLGYSGGAYDMLRLISAICGAGAILIFFRFCYKRFSMRPVSSLLCSGLLLFSYGFWRYAAEAEVIVPAAFMMLLAIYFAVAPDKPLSQVAVAGVLCGVSVLFHILNVIPVFLAVPLFYAIQREWKEMLMHLASALAVVAVAYLGVYHFEDEQLFSSYLALREFTPASFIKAGIGFSQCVASSNFILGFEGVRSMLVDLFPSRMLLEELYLGTSLPQWQVLTASFTALLLATCGLAVVVLAIKAILLKQRGERRRDRIGSLGGLATLAVALVWFLAYTGAILLLEPGNPEVWVMGLVPFWLFFCGFIVAPLSKKNFLWPVLLLTILLGIHNYCGGMLPLQDPAGNYNRQKADWIMKNAEDGDIVLTAGNPVFERYLRYFSVAEVVYLHEWSEEKLLNPEIALNALRLRLKEGGQIFLFDDVFHQPKSLTIRFTEKTDAINRFAEAIQPRVKKLYGDEFGGGYVLDTPGAAR